MAADTHQLAIPPRRSAVSAVGVFLIFALVGPPLAALIFIGILPVYEQRSTFPDSFEELIYGIGRLVPAAYFFGGLQLGATGVAAALWLWFARRPRVSLILVLLVSFATAVIAVLVLAKPMSMPAPHPGIVAGVFVLHLGAAVGCGLIANALLWAVERQPTRTVTP